MFSGKQHHRHSNSRFSNLCNNIHPMQRRHSNNRLLRTETPWIINGGVKHSFYGASGNQFLSTNLPYVC